MRNSLKARSRAAVVVLMALGARLLPGCSLGLVGLLWLAAGGVNAQSVTTVAGGGPIGPVPALQVALPWPSSFARDAAGAVITSSGNRIYRIDSSGILTLVAGNGRGQMAKEGSLATDSPIAAPAGVAVGADGSIYFSERHGHRVFRIDPAAGVLQLVAGTGEAGFGGDGGPAIEAMLDHPDALAFDRRGGLLVVDLWNQRVRRISLGIGWMDTVAGDGAGGDGGLAKEARLEGPTDVEVSQDGASIFVSEGSGCRVRRVDAGSGVITTVAGTGDCSFSGDGGPATAAEIDYPLGIALDDAGNLLIADAGNGRVRLVSATTGLIDTIAGPGERDVLGDGGPATEAYLESPVDCLPDHGGVLIAADNRLRRVDPAGRISTWAGTGSPAFGGDGAQARDATFQEPLGLAIDAAGNLFLADRKNGRVRRVDAVTGIVSTVAGGGQAYPGDGGPATEASLSDPRAVVLDDAGHLLIADRWHGRVYQVDLDTGLITTVAGGGRLPLSDGLPATSVYLGDPNGLALAADGALYVTTRDRVLRLDRATGLVWVVAGPGIGGELGDGGPAREARIIPTGVALDEAGNIYIADAGGNHRVRRIDAMTGIITTVAGGGVYRGDGPATTLALGSLAGVAVAGSHLYLIEGGSGLVRHLDLPTGILTTLAGPFGLLGGIALGHGGEILLSDKSDDRILRVTLPPAAIADVSVAVVDAPTVLHWSRLATYRIEVANAGPDDATAVTVWHDPPQFMSLTWSCFGSGGATCSASGYDRVSERVSLPPGGAVTFEVIASAPFAEAPLTGEFRAGLMPAPWTNDADSDDHTSASSFSVVRLKLTAPTGYESWPAGSSQAVTWEGGGFPPGAELDIWLRRPEGETLVARVPATEGRYIWKVPALPTAHASIHVRYVVAGRLVAHLWSYVFTISTGSDFNGDGSTDILWRHETSGHLYAWLLSGSVTTGASYLTPDRLADSRWQVRGLADLDGDGKTDILWQDQISGDLYVWFLDGTVARRGAFLTPSRGDPRWQIRGVSDISGDGRPDILWQHPVTGDLYVWTLDGTVTVGGRYLTPSRLADPRWQIRGVADFDGDTRADILWHHQETGELYVWRLEWGVTTGGSYLTPSRFADTRWQIRKVADFDGDGKVDLLWQNQVTGDLYVWFLDGLSVKGGSFLDPSRSTDTRWRIVPS